MEAFTPNGLSRSRGVQLPVRNGGFKDTNGGSALTAGPSQQLRDSFSAENVPKSRSNEWYMLSPSQTERNNNYYCKDMQFPKSVTSGILSPDFLKYPSCYANPALRGPAISSGRWPNSIEDPERETTRSSSNPAISSSISDEDFIDRKVEECSMCSSLRLNPDENPVTPSRTSEDDPDAPTKHRQPTDSLPRHRERLSQHRKSIHGKRGSDNTVTTENLRKRRTRSTSSSTSSNLTSFDDVAVAKNIQKVHPERITSSFPQLRNGGIHYSSVKRPHDLRLCSHVRDANSMADVGSWLANQSFDYIDSSYSPLNTMRSPVGSEHWRGSEPEVFRRSDEIFFCSPTPRDVTFNVSGQHYRIDPEILGRFPDTLLGNQEKRAKYWDPFRNEYFLDRHRATFEVVIEYYVKNGILRRPDDIPIDIFIHEVKFYCLDRENIHNFLSTEGILLVVKEKPMPNTAVKRFIWNLFEDPESCWTARLVTTMSAIVIAISVVVFCMETVPSFKSLGESSLENIGPALNKCEHAFERKPEFFYPVGDLFAKQKNEPNQRPVEEELKKHKDNHDSGPRFEKYHMMGQSQADRVADNSMIDSFDSHVIISTMQRTLSECASNQDMDVLTKYTLLRCYMELTDAFTYDGTPIKLILSEVEVHDHGHESEKKEHHEEEEDHEEELLEEEDGHDADDNTVQPEEDEEGESDHEKEEHIVELDDFETTTVVLSRDGRSRPVQVGDDVAMAKRQFATVQAVYSDVNEFETGERRKEGNLTISGQFPALRHKKKSNASKSKQLKSKTAHIKPTGLFNGTKTARKRKSRKKIRGNRKSGKGKVRRTRSKHPSHHDIGKRSVQENNSLLEEEENHENRSRTGNKTQENPKILTLKQTTKALNHVCSELDKHSIRSSYAWFVLEASLGGPAGQLFLIESGCIVWFVIEIVLRLYSCPDKMKFCTNFLNIIDAIAILPYFITLIVTSLHTDTNLRPQTATILRTIRLVRMLRILKLSRHSRGLRILGLTLVRSTRVLVLLVCFQMVLAVTFSSIVYYVEYDAVGTDFKSIPGSFWWAIITMTTVGYGDVVPTTTWGKITGAFCAIMGILGIAFPVPVIVSNFNYLYNLDSDDCKLTAEELMGDKEDDKNNNVEKFQENLFDAVRRNVGSMTGGPQEAQPTGQNPAELWNYTRRQYHGIDKKPQKTQDAGRSNKFTKGLVAIATASALTVSLPDSTIVTSRPSSYRRKKATSI